MSEVRPTLSSDPDRFTRLLNEALEELPARELASFLHTLAETAGRAHEAQDSDLLIAWLEGIAVTHALRHNSDYRLAEKDVEMHGGEPVPEDMGALRAQLTG